ncbi:MAG TPA: hypothetical protein VJL82_06090 [Rhizomicrobium sp.]|nr:hypothetical protein [Rhizomicrobium sp.]
MNRIQDFVESAAPVADDIDFEWRVMQRMEQRRFRRTMLENGLIALAAAVALIGAAPMLSMVWRESLAPVIGNGMLIGTLVAVVYTAQQILRLQET